VPAAEKAGFRIREQTARTRVATEHGKTVCENLNAFLESAECSPADAAEIEQRLGFSYPYEKAAAMKSKYAVTELAGLAAMHEAEAAAQQADKPFAAAAPRFLSAGSALTAAERGSLLHRALERMDFRAAREGLSRPGYLEESLGDLVSCGVFTREEAEAVDVEQLRNFFASDICGRAAASPELHKETPFVMRKELNGEDILVQGVIDCWFSENDALVLLDYKSGRAFARGANPGEEALRRFVARYRPQLAVYAEALESIRGARVSEAVLFLLGEGRCVRVDLHGENTPKNV
jgi:ATP-dependent helicase/nuclease subunit A